jgi:hypothetical protein
MRLISKVSAIVCASFLLVNTAFAVDAPAVKPVSVPASAQPFSKINKPAAWQIAIINNTFYDYMVYAAYLPSHLLWDTYLGPYGYPTDEIYYSYGVSNYCFNIVRQSDYAIVYAGCKVSGTIYLNPPADAKNSQAKPVVKITD